MSASAWSILWASDFAQIYIIDAREGFLPKLDAISPEDVARRCLSRPHGAVIFTNDSLFQVVRVELLQADDASPLLDAPEGATIEQARIKVHFPSRAFILSSPSRSGGAAQSPRFPAPAHACVLDVVWAQFQGPRYAPDGRPPDLIVLRVKPA